MGDSLLTWEQIFRVVGIATIVLFAMMSTIVTFTWMFQRQAKYLEDRIEDLCKNKD